MGIFVMGDIHGAYRAMLQCLERSGFDFENDTLIQLGDVTDGYPQVCECVGTLLKVRNLIALKGNHDDWFDDFIKTGLHPYFWNHGGKGTLISYLNHSGKNGRFFATKSGFKTALESEDIPQTHKAFFDSQELYYIDKQQRCFVHAGFNRHLPFNKQRKEDFYWNRDLWVEALRYRTYFKATTTNEDFFEAVDFLEIYIGHTPTTNWGTDKPLRALNILNLDTGAGHSGRLTIMEIETKEYWQSNPLPELYAKNFRQKFSY